MSTAQRLFIGYGTIILLVGFMLGTVLGALRMKKPPLRNLVAAHVETLMQASMHFGLAFAVGIASFDSGWGTGGALLLVAGSAMQATGVTLNWMMATSDQFAQRSPGFMLNTVGTYVIWPGAAIVAWGILSGL